MRQDFDQIAIRLDGDAMLLGQGDDLVGHEAHALAHQPRGRVPFLVVFKGDGFFLRLCLAGGWFLRHTKVKGHRARVGVAGMPVQ